MDCCWAKGTNCSDGISSMYLYINNCGYYIDIDMDISVDRKYGRMDYQMIYIAAGEGTFYLDDQNRTMQKGSIILYPPNTMQKYIFDKSKGSSYYWIHFSGTAAAEILAGLGLTEFCYHPGDFYDFIETCKKIVSAYQTGSVAHETFAAGSLISLLALLSKKINSATTKFHDVIELMAKDFRKQYSNEDYAAMYGMSQYAFIRAFKKATGATPYLYRASLIIDKGKLLLRDTGMQIQEISAHLGFEDPLYFSRFFKKHTGISPLTYRAQEHHI